MKYFLVISFCLLYTSTLSYANLGLPCLTPNKEQAYCVPLSHCPPMTNLTELNEELVQFLRSSHCGFKNSEPLVCCGYAGNYKKIDYAAHILDTLPLVTKINDLLPSMEICGRQGLEDRIVGGNEAQLDEFPWMAVLEYRNTIGESTGHSCGGVLISSRYVLTAAHCVSPWKLFRVRLGEHDLRTPIDCIDYDGEMDCADPSEDFLVEDVTIHPQYFKNQTALFNDIALIRLNKKVKFTDFITPICLPLDVNRSTPGSLVYVAGWGVTDDGTYSPVKQKVALPILDPNLCVEKFLEKGVFASNLTQICTLSEDGKDACRGDSGGPLMRKLNKLSNIWYVEGLVSFGPTICASQDIPGVYTNVIEYLYWILPNLKM